MGDSNGTSAAYLQPQHQQTAYQYTQQQLQPQQTCAYTQVQHAPQTAAYAYTQPQQQQQQQHAVSNLNSLLYSNQQQVQLAAPHTPQGQNACYSYVNHAPNHQQQQLAAAFTTTSVPYHTPNGFYYGSYHYMQHQLQQQQHYQQQQQQMQYVYNFQQQPVAANSARPAYTYSTINPYATSTTAQQPGQQVVGYQTAHTAAWAEYTNTTLPILTAQQQAVPASYASSKPAAAAASAATVKPEPVPAAAAAAAARSPKVADEPTAEHWYIPSRFLQLPDTTSAHTVKFDLRKMTHAQLLKAAARYNSDHDVGDPIADTLDGVVEKARLRPGSSPAHAFTMGGVPNDSIYAKAWRGIKRGGKPPSTDTARLLDKVRHMHNSNDTLTCLDRSNSWIVQWHPLCNLELPCCCTASPSMQKSCVCVTNTQPVCYPDGLCALTCFPLHLFGALPETARQSRWQANEISWCNISSRGWYDAIITSSWW